MKIDRIGTNKARPVLNIFFILDVSGSMCGEKISSLNTCMSSAINLTRGIAAENPEYQINFCVQEFGCPENIKWITENPEPVEQFEWKRLDAYGGTPLGAALRDLGTKLSKTQFMASETGILQPVFIFMTDGYPDNSSEVYSELESLKNNTFFLHSNKAAIALGSGTDMDMLRKLAGSDDTVFEAHSIDRLKEIIDFIIMSSTMLACTVVKGANSAVSAQQQFQNQAAQQKKNAAPERDKKF